MVNKKSLATFVRTLGNQAIAGFKHFLNNVKIGGTLTINAESLTEPATTVLTLDGNNVVRSATSFTGISVDATSKIKHEVKAGVAVNKGQAVYVTSADGTNMIVGLASNTTEATSSKTMGLMESTLAINGKGDVITEGLLAGLNTSAATAGDPVWLGTGGNLLYGLANKPVAPAHMVFIGIVTRSNNSNGEIFVKVQNGFELQELHNVLINGIANNNLIAYETSSGLWKNKTTSALNIITGTGTTNAVAVYDDVKSVTYYSELNYDPTDNNLTSNRFTAIDDANPERQLRLRNTFTPSGTGDTAGLTGNICWDDSNLYIKTSAGWKRVGISTF